MYRTSSCIFSSSESLYSFYFVLSIFFKSRMWRWDIFVYKQKWKNNKKRSSGLQRTDLEKESVLCWWEYMCLKHKVIVTKLLQMPMDVFRVFWLHFIMHDNFFLLSYSDGELVTKPLDILLLLHTYCSVYPFCQKRKDNKLSCQMYLWNVIFYMSKDTTLFKQAQFNISFQVLSVPI